MKTNTSLFASMKPYLLEKSILATEQVRALTGAASAHPKSRVPAGTVSGDNGGGMAEVIGIIAGVLAAWFAWPQAIRALRAPSVEGVSASGTTLMVATGVTWVTYGILITDWLIIVANAFAAIAMFVTLVVVVLGRPQSAPLVMALTILWVAMLVGTGLVWGSTAVGLMGAALGVAMTVPQASRAVRGHGSEGVSFSTYILLAVMMGCWLVYGVLRSDFLIVLPNVLALPVVSTVCVLLYRRRHLPGVDSTGVARDIA